jgi:hypothetical protein
MAVCGQKQALFGCIFRQWLGVRGRQAKLRQVAGLGFGYLKINEAVLVVKVHGLGTDWGNDTQAQSQAPTPDAGTVQCHDMIWKEKEGYESIAGKHKYNGNAVSLQYLSTSNHTKRACCETSS